MPHCLVTCMNHTLLNRTPAIAEAFYRGSITEYEGVTAIFLGLQPLPATPHLSHPFQEMTGRCLVRQHVAKQRGFLVSSVLFVVIQEQLV